MHDGAQALASPRALRARGDASSAAGFFPPALASAECTDVLPGVQPPSSAVVLSRQDTAIVRRQRGTYPHRASSACAPSPGGHFFIGTREAGHAPSALQRRTDGLPPDRDGRAARRGRGRGREDAAMPPCGGQVERWLRAHRCAAADVRPARRPARSGWPARRRRWSRRARPAMTWPGGHGAARRTYSPVTGRLSTRILCLCISR